MMGDGWGGFGGGGGLLLMVGGVLLLIGVIVLVVWAVSTISRSSHPPASDPSRPTPNDILRERFARGEISEQEFEQARKILGPDR
jgi:putative membrane protein